MALSRLWAVLSGLIVACGAQSATAQHFYDGKTVTIVVGTEAGGGFDIYARALSRHIRSHMPGAPTVIVQNMPGAGSLKAAEYLYVLAPKDGTTFGLVYPGAIIEPLISGPANFRYDPTKFEYIGSADSGTRLCITAGTSKIKTFDDALKLPSNIGGSAPGSSTTDYAQLLVSLTGAKMHIVNGYKSSIDTIVAIERGEVDGLCGYDVSSFKAQRPDWFGTDKANMILQVSLEPNAELTKMGVPPLWNYISGEARAIAELIVAQQEFHRPFVAPPGTPAPQMAILRTAFMETMRDPAFLADAAAMKLDIHPKDAETVAKLVTKMYSQPPELVAKMRKALRP